MNGGGRIGPRGFVNDGYPIRHDQAMPADVKTAGSGFCQVNEDKLFVVDIDGHVTLT